MSVPAWQVLDGMPAWQVTQIPRPALAGGDGAGGAGPDAPPAASGGRGQRMLSLASAARSGSAVAFGWVRDTGSGPVSVIAAGKGLCADDDGAMAAAVPPGTVPLGYPAGALGRPLPPGGLTAAFTALPYWMPVAITPVALLA